MTEGASNHPDQQSVAPPPLNTDRGPESSASRVQRSARVAFFVGQAAILLTFPIEAIATLAKLPSFADAQANEGLIFALCAYIPLVIACEILAWVAFAKKRTLLMLVATLVPLLGLATLVYLALYTV